MADNLQWFKFYTSKWNQGNITYCSFEAQGLFINLCSFYWSREGDLQESKMKKRFNCDDSFWNELLDEKIITIEDDLIKINFLDEQRKEFKKKANVSRNNGKSGGRPAKSDVEKRGNLIFYIVRLYSVSLGEDFIKTGVTSLSVKKRMKGIPNYEYEEISSYEIPKLKALKAEAVAQKVFKRYSPQKKFGGGAVECFYYNAEGIQELIRFLTNPDTNPEETQQVNLQEPENNPLREEKRREDKEKTREEETGDSIILNKDKKVDVDQMAHRDVNDLCERFSIEIGSEIYWKASKRLSVIESMSRLDLFDRQTIAYCQLRDLQKLDFMGLERWMGLGVSYWDSGEWAKGENYTKKLQDYKVKNASQFGVGNNTLSFSIGKD